MSVETTYPRWATGLTVVFRVNREPGDLDRRMAVVEDRGDRVLVRDLALVGMRIEPTFVYLKSELWRSDDLP